jgi:hypothetical protein
VSGLHQLPASCSTGYRRDARLLNDPVKTWTDLRTATSAPSAVLGKPVTCPSVPCGQLSRKVGHAHVSPHWVAGTDTPMTPRIARSRLSGRLRSSAGPVAPTVASHHLRHSARRSPGAERSTRPEPRLQSFIPAPTASRAIVPATQTYELSHALGPTDGLRPSAMRLGPRQRVSPTSRSQSDSDDSHPRFGRLLPTGALIAPPRKESEEVLK